MINKIKYWIEAIKTYKFVVEELEREITLNSKLVKKVNSLQEIAKDHLKLLNDWVRRSDADDKEYWDGKWNQAKVYYSAPKRKLVTEYLTYRQIPEVKSISNSLIQKHSLSRDNPDSVPITVLKWLESNFKSKKFVYKLDKGETWYTPEQILNKKIGDCDDWAILEYYLVREIFMEFELWDKVKHRLKCVDGHTHYSGPFSPYAGRHLYLVWLHSEGNFYTVESTFYRQRAILNYGKKPQKFNPQYGLINYTFTDYTSFAQRSLTVTRKGYNYKKRKR